MIGRLQRKYVLIAMGSLLVILVTIIGCVNVFSLYHIGLSADRVLDAIAENDGDSPEYRPYQGSLGKSARFFRIAPDIRFMTRYFIVRTSSDGRGAEADIGNASDMSAEQAIGYARNVLESGGTRGYHDDYRYLAVERPGGKLVIFLDQKLPMRMLFSSFWSSCGVALFILVVMFALVSVFSKRAIKPIADSFEKQKRFLADAGHELKTPLAIISANAEVLELNHGKSEWTDSILRQTGRMDDLVKGMLALSRLEEEKIQFAPRDFSMSELVLEEAVSFETLAKRQNKSFELDIQPDISFHGDENGIRQVVSVLLDNAVKYSGDDGGIRTSLRRQGRTLCLEVRNTVDNMPEGDLGRLFDRFYRADPSRSRESGGYGLGLAIAKAVVQSHKGKISARREDGMGILFSVTLKLPSEL